MEFLKVQTISRPQKGRNCRVPVEETTSWEESVKILVTL